MKPKLSIIVTVYNEELNIKPLIKQITEALEDFAYEIIYVDDGSTDNTVKELKSVGHKSLKIIELKKNHGQSLALMAGIDHAQGEYIVTMDGDLQNDPSDIPMMLQLAEEGEWDMVAGIRAKRKDKMLLRKIPSKIANFIIRQSSGVKMKDYGCALKVFKSDLAKDLGLYGELHRFIAVLAHLEGAKITQVDVKHHAREFGTSKYGLNRTIKVMSDLLLMLFFKKYMQKPMHLFGNLGVITLGIGVIINLYLAFLKIIMGHDIWGKPLLILGLMLVIGGIQFITIGIIIEIQMRTYFESQQKKPYKIKNIW
ncbi:MAG: glycosyltransferase family 2 protein [Bacteroidetes bacterium]|nr:glycosyltransferase family 2 protein [Bacteroidota bacterium]